LCRRSRPRRAVVRWRCGTFVTMAYFDPATALELIKAEQVTGMFPAFPPLTLGMLNCPDYRLDSFARVRTVFTVAPPEALRAMQRRVAHVLDQGADVPAARAARGRTGRAAREPATCVMLPRICQALTAGTVLCHGI